MANNLAKLILAASMVVAGCAAPQEEKKAESTLGGGSYVNSSIFGKVLSSKIENNQVAYEPYIGPDYDTDNKAYVHIIGTGFEAQTISGNYNIQGIPVGLYEIESQPDKIPYEIHPYTSKVIYISQVPTEAPDLKLIVEPIINGKVRGTSGAPIPGFEISLYTSNGSVCFDPELYSTITSSDGSYAFLRSKYGHGDLERFCVKSQMGSVYFSSAGSDKKFIPFQYNIVNEDITVQ